MKANTTSLILPVILLAVAMPAALAETGWQQVDASAPFTDSNGIARAPSCSGALVPQPMSDPPVLVPAPTDFSFFYRDGNADRLVIGFDGGGACWDPITCVASVLDGNPVYDIVVDETPASLDATGGLFDTANPENPIADSFQVFIPYCTGDLHTGARDTDYEVLTPAGPVSKTIHHRGYDNFIAVLEWLIDHYQNDVGTAPREVIVLGASAGGYGAYFAYPAIDELLPFWTRRRVLSDSAIGIVNQDFFDRALTPGGVWGVWENMPAELAGAFSSGPDALPVLLNQSLAWHFPRARFGQYTRAFDAVQIFYLNVAKHLDTPAAWTDPLQLFFTGLEWSAKTRTSLAASALTTVNYRFYLGEGFDHTAIADDSVYLEDSAGGVRLIDWLDDMINRRFPFGGDWRNLSCGGSCIP